MCESNMFWETLHIIVRQPNFLEVTKMEKFKATPFKIYVGNNGELIHFNVMTLALSELEQQHVDLLDEFAEFRRIDEVLTTYADKQDLVLYLEDLIELKMINDIETPITKDRTLLSDGLPTAYRIVLTEYCNLACAECFVTKNRTNLATMPEDTLIEVIDNSIRNATGRILTYHFFGGEPLIRFDLIQKAVARLNEAVEIGIIKQPVYTITTNATRVTDEMIKFFTKNNFIVGVSVDGNRKTHNALRPYINGRGSYDDVTYNYRRMVEAGVNAHVLITPNPRYLENLVGIARDIMDTFPMQTITINTPFKYDTLEWSVPGKQYAEILFDIMRVAKAKDITVDSAASPAIAAIANSIRRTSACSITGEAFMASVSPSGSLSYCAQKWHECLLLPKRPAVDVQTKCKQCEAFGICGGVCPAFSTLSGISYDRNKCDFMHMFLSLIAKNLDLFVEQEVDYNDNGP